MECVVEFMRMRYLTLLILSFIISFSVQAETDTTYIRTFPQEFSLRPYVYRKFTMLSLEAGEKEAYTYYPNTPVGLGIGLAYKNYTLNLAYAPPVFRDQSRGRTKYIDFQYHYYGRKYIFDFFFQDYEGFYQIEKEGQKRTLLYPDVKVVQYGVDGQYVFNNKKFSYRAAFYCNEKQIRSAGSFQVGGGFYYNKLVTDTTQILDGKSRFSNNQFSLTGGYVYSWVFKKDFFITVGVSVGGSLGWEKVQDTRTKVELTPCFFPRASMGYNGEKIAVYLNVVMKRQYVTRSGNRDVIFDTGRVNLCYVQRLNWSPGILKKIKVLNR